MAFKFTQEQFEKALADSGLSQQFSAADLALARQNPDFGMSAISYKQDYANATTDEMRALANSGLESLRSGLGGYTGGADGGGYYLNPLSPGSFGGSTQNAYGNNSNVNDLLGQLINRPEFSYDAGADPLYSQYKKQYTREGQLATDNALAAAAGASGGIPSSYAVGAAATAGNSYAAALTDKLPELYQLAYSKYMNDYNMKLSDLEAAQKQDSIDYGRMLDEVNYQTAARQEAAANELTDWEQQYKLAALGQTVGDNSGLQALGIEPPVTPTAEPAAVPGYDPTPKPGDPVGLDDADVQAIIDQNGGSTELTEELWEQLKQDYGFLTDEMLSAAGFTKKKDNGDGAPKLDSVKDYDSAVAYMKAAGVDNATRASMMTRSDWTRRKAALQSSGVGSSEVKNYAKYADYVRDYAQYAVSK